MHRFVHYLGNCMTILAVLAASEVSRAHNTICSAALSPYSAAAELEIKVSPQFWSMTTTPDGTVGSFAYGAKTIPSAYIEWVHKTKGTSYSMWSVQWDEVPPEIKKLLVAQVAKTVDFWHIRRIPNLLLKKKIEVTFNEPTLLMGQLYEKGTHTIDTSNFLTSYIELANVRDKRDFQKVELHFRSNDSAGKLLETTWTFEENKIGPRTYLHVHVVAPIPKKALSEHSLPESLARTEHFRLTNLVAELYYITRFVPIKSEYGFYGMTFDSLNPQRLLNAFLFFYHRGNPKKIIKDKKEAWVSLRADAYDTPGVYGYEFRAISGNDSLSALKSLLDRIHTDMVTGDVAFSTSNLWNWYQHQTENLQRDMFEVVENTWYRKPFKQLYQELHPGLKPHLSFITRRKFEFYGWKTESIKMLLYDWTSDPLFWNDSAAQTRILQSQQRALTRLKTEYNYLRVIADFAKESGLWERVTGSFGMQPRDFQ
ncbi:MAG: hypothetical protein AB7F59_06355 [Bdellovibrionales bacterium]